MKFDFLLEQKYFGFICFYIPSNLFFLSQQLKYQPVFIAALFFCYHNNYSVYNSIIKLCFVSQKIEEFMTYLISVFENRF